MVTAASNYQTGASCVSAFSPGDADNGWFSSEDVNSADLIFIKTHNPGSGLFVN